MKKLIALMAFITFSSAFACTLPDWVAPNTKHAAMEELKFNASHFTILTIDSKEVPLSDGYAAIEVSITFTNSYNELYKQTAVCNPIRNRLLCRYSLIDKKTLKVINESEGFFSRQE